VLGSIRAGVPAVPPCALLQSTAAISFSQETHRRNGQPCRYSQSLSLPSMYGPFIELRGMSSNLITVRRRLHRQFAVDPAERLGNSAPPLCMVFPLSEMNFAACKLHSVTPACHWLRRQDSGGPDGVLGNREGGGRHSAAHSHGTVRERGGCAAGL
jgi:hypothetical protein